MTSAEHQVNAAVPEPPFSHEQVASVLEEVARSSAPSRFALYGIVEDPDGGYDGDLIAWGLGFDDHVSVQAIDSAVGGTFRSTDSMIRVMCRRDRDIRLLWIDPEPTN